jgi:glycerol uptake facilitator-like aquaporin
MGNIGNKLVIYKKYAQMAGILVGACIFYVLVKKNPKNAAKYYYGVQRILKIFAC